MITSKLKPCCYACTCPDVEVETEYCHTISQLTPEAIATCTIYCSHYKVCKTYIESEE